MTVRGVREPCTTTVEFVPGEVPTNRPETRYAEGGSYVWKCSNGHTGTGVARYSVAEGMARRHAKPGCVPVQELVTT